jgi:hypothetical protein
MSKHFGLSPPTVKEILRRELGLKFSRRWVPHLLSDAQKKLRVDASRQLLSMLGMYAEYNFEELQLVMSSGSNILLILIRYLLVPEKAPCQESGGRFADKKPCLPFSLHQGDF